MLRMAWVVVRRTVRLPSPLRSMARGTDGDVDGDDLTGVNTAQGDLLAGDHDAAGVARDPLHGRVSQTYA